LTRTHFHPHRIAAKGTGCSLIQNVTVKVSFKGSNLSDPASSAAHVSLSSHLQLSNNRRTKKPSTKPAPNLSQEQQTSIPPIRLSFFRTKDFVASSAAALVQ
jgi:hypothetical protein